MLHRLTVFEIEAQFFMTCMTPTSKNINHLEKYNKFLYLPIPLKNLHNVFILEWFDMTKRFHYSFHKPKCFSATDSSDRYINQDSCTTCSKIVKVTITKSYEYMQLCAVLDTLNKLILWVLRTPTGLWSSIITTSKSARRLHYELIW